jgi:cyanate permease
MVISAIFTACVPYATNTTSAVALISMALFFIEFAGTACWGLVHTNIVTSNITASVGSIQNCASFMIASCAPFITGWVLDTTQSFDLSLKICACITLFGALCYLFLVNKPINVSSITS